MTKQRNYWLLPEQWLTEEDDSDLPEYVHPDPELNEIQPDEVEGE